MIGVVTLPFSVERFRYNNAKEGLQQTSDSNATQWS